MRNYYYRYGRKKTPFFCTFIRTRMVAQCLVFCFVFVEDPLPIPRPIGNMSRKRHNQTTVHFADEYLQRKEMVIKTCRRKYVIDSYKFGFERSKEILYVPSSGNVTYCKVPKAGSTLISHLFFLMTGKSHGNVHLAGNARFGKGWIRARTVKTGMKFLVARDPFSRLFSAYINKYLLMEHRRQLNSMQQRYKRDMFSIGGEVCGYNLTFQDFLDFSLDVAFNTQRRIDRHWAPVYLLCHPCEMDYDVIAKQETLSQDLKFIIEHFNLSISAKRVLSERVEIENYCKRMEHIMKHVFHRNSNCPSTEAYLYRVWTSFKNAGIHKG